MQKQLINGEWAEACNGNSLEVTDPATEAVVATVPYGDGADCALAIGAAQAAFGGWSGMTPFRRADLLKRAADIMRGRIGELARVTVRESGKPYAEARGEWSVAADFFEWYAEEGKRAYGYTIPSSRGSKRMSVIYQPIGVVGIITAWNFPAYNPARALAAALGAGCTAVVKPSEYTPLTAMAMVGALQEAGLPPGVVNLVNGDPASVGAMMLEHPSLRKIHFTGSTRVGRILMDGASKTFTRLSLELGGNAPVLIFPDVEVEALARSAVGSKCRNAGQVCISPQRFFVHRDIAEEFAGHVVRYAGKLVLGNGLDPDTEVGPLISARQRERVIGLVEEARANQAEVLAGGRIPEGFGKGFFYEPTVLANLREDAAVLREEIFGPVLPIRSFDAMEEALELANRTPYGLAAYVWTKDLKTALRVSEQLEFGMVGINEWAPHGTEAPFIGWKASGLGHESGPEGLREYMEKKLIGIGGL